MPVEALRKVENKPEENVVAILEKWLEMAKRGDVITIAGASVNREGNVGTFSTGEVDMAALIGALRWLERDLIDRWVPADNGDGQ